MQPYAFSCSRNHALCTQNLAIFRPVSQIVQELFQTLSRNRPHVLTPPACKDVVRVMMAVVIMMMIMIVAAAFFLMAVMMRVSMTAAFLLIMAVMMRVIVAAAFFLMVVMMMRVIMAAAFFVLIMVMAVCVHVLSGLAHQLFCHIVFLLNDLQSCAPVSWLHGVVTIFAA